MAEKFYLSWADLKVIFPICFWPWVKSLFHRFLYVTLDHKLGLNLNFLLFVHVDSAKNMFWRTKIHLTKMKLSSCNLMYKIERHYAETAKASLLRRKKLLLQHSIKGDQQGSKIILRTLNELYLMFSKTDCSIIFTMCSISRVKSHSFWIEFAVHSYNIPTDKNSVPTELLSHNNKRFTLQRMLFRLKNLTFRCPRIRNWNEHDSLGAFLHLCSKSDGTNEWNLTEYSRQPRLFLQKPGRITLNG